MQFVCRMYKLQHEKGRYFLHEHGPSELPWPKDCVEEIQEMTGAKLMSFNQGSCSLPSITKERNVELNEKPTVMGTNCPAIAFTLRVSAKARLLNKRYTEHLERNEHKSIEDLREDISSGIQLERKWSRQHKYLLASVGVKNPRANFNDLENSVLLKSQTMICSIKHETITPELLWTRRRSRKPGSFRWSITTSCTCSIKCLGAPESKMG